MLLCADADADAASVGLAGGLLSLPIVQHRAAGAVGHGAERVIRLLDGAMARLRPDGARCRSCKRTHILLPTWRAPRRADAIEVTGTPPQLRATPRTWWPTLPCGRSRPRSPPGAPSRSGCRSRRAGAIGGRLARHAPFGPACARHGADPRQIEISAAVIRIFERLGWATSVHWPTRARLEPRCRDQGQHPANAGTPHSEALISPAPT